MNDEIRNKTYLSIIPETSEQTDYAAQIEALQTPAANALVIVSTFALTAEDRKIVEELCAKQMKSNYDSILSEQEIEASNVDSLKFNHYDYPLEAK